MTEYMIDNITVTRESIYKGAGRVVTAPSGTSFPGRLESVMQPATPADDGETAYALSADWTDVGPTNEDGITIRREAEVSDGIPLDQRNTNLDEGEPENWSMEGEMTLMHTNLATVQIAWEGGTLRNFEVSSKSHLTYHRCEEVL